MVGDIRGEVDEVDRRVILTLSASGDGDGVFPPAARDRLIRLLVALAHGVLAMSQAIPGLVETSSNLAVVHTTGGRVGIVTSSRSSVASSLDGVLASIRALGELAEADVDTLDGYPGWKPDLSSPVLATVSSVYGEVWGRPPKVTAIHAGLECGLLGDKVPGLDMVSFGPTIVGAHSPAERVHIPSVGRFWDALVRVLDRLAAVPA